MDHCGLVIKPAYPFLAASPDGLVGQKSVVEVKCPYTGRYDKIKAGENFIFLTDDYQLKKTHKYYDQIQGQLYLTNRTHCYFVIHTFVDFKVIDVSIDLEYCESLMIPKLTEFYYKYFLPYLTNRL